MLQQRQMIHTNNVQEGNKPKIRFDSFIGLSGVYSISHHYDYEAGRGVEQISPMQPACGSSRKLFDLYSPHLRLRDLLGVSSQSDTNATNDSKNKEVVMVEETRIMKDLPPMLLVHGVEDHVVPFTSTSEAARIIKSCGATCKEYYVPKTDHADVVMHFMLGGKSKDFVMKSWIHGDKVGNVVIPSRL
jgi:hypothetical protein